jgi:hypothetical protein
MCFNEAYFARLLTHVLAALNTTGITAVSVMLQPSVGHLTYSQYSGFSNPFLLANNANDINCDTGEGPANVNSNCDELSTLLSGVNGANILAIQDAYARHPQLSCVDESHDRSRPQLRGDGGAEGASGVDEPLSRNNDRQYVFEHPPPTLPRPTAKGRARP